MYIHLKQIGVSYHCFASSSLFGDWAKAMWTLFNYILIKSLRALLEKLKTLYASLFDSNLSGVFLLTHKSTRCAQPVWTIFQVMKVKKKCFQRLYIWKFLWGLKNKEINFEYGSSRSGVIVRSVQTEKSVYCVFNTLFTNVSRIVVMTSLSSVFL